jgi:hypothetical protein
LAFSLVLIMHSHAGYMETITMKLTLASLGAALSACLALGCGGMPDSAAPQLDSRAVTVGIPLDAPPPGLVGTFVPAKADTTLSGIIKMRLSANHALDVEFSPTANVSVKEHDRWKAVQSKGKTYLVFGSSLSMRLAFQYEFADAGRALKMRHTDDEPWVRFSITANDDRAWVGGTVGDPCGIAVAKNQKPLDREITQEPEKSLFDANYIPPECVKGLLCAGPPPSTLNPDALKDLFDITDLHSCVVAAQP